MTNSLDVVMLCFIQPSEPTIENSRSGIWGSDLWNGLPRIIRDMSYLSSFKNVLRNCIIRVISVCSLSFFGFFFFSVVLLHTYMILVRSWPSQIRFFNAEEPNSAIYIPSGFLVVTYPVIAYVTVMR